MSKRETQQPLKKQQQQHKKNNLTQRFYEKTNDKEKIKSIEQIRKTSTRNQQARPVSRKHLPPFI